MDTLSSEEHATASSLIALGLPEVQAIKSAKARTAGPNPKSGAASTHIYGSFQIKKDADMAALKAALQAYSEASRSSPGKVTASYTMSEKNGEVYFFEVFDSMNAMDIHISNCFPHWILMMPHATLVDCIASCDSDIVDEWTTSLSAWGATKFVVEPNI